MAYHMPRDSNTMPICSPSKHECVEKAVGIVEQTAFDVTGRIWLNHLLQQSGASEFVLQARIESKTNLRIRFGK